MSSICVSKKAPTCKKFIRKICKNLTPPPFSPPLTQTPPSHKIAYTNTNEQHFCNSNWRVNFWWGPSETCYATLTSPHLTLCRFIKKFELVNLCYLCGLPRPLRRKQRWQNLEYFSLHNVNQIASLA